MAATVSSARRCRSAPASPSRTNIAATAAWRWPISATGHRTRAKSDAIEHLKKLMTDAGVSEDKIKDIDKEIRQVVAESADFAESAPEPELSELYTDVLVEQY